MDILSLTSPIDNQHAANNTEIDIAAAFKAVFDDQFSEQINNMLDYGCPHLGSQTVLERFAKQDGLLVLRRSDTATAIMRLLYSNWLSQGGKRGLNYLNFALSMVWGKSYTITRLFHSIKYINKYPMFLSQTETTDTFLTSRIMVKINSGIDLAEVSELAPILRRLVPANIVANVTSDALNTDTNYDIGTVLVGRVFNVIDFGAD